MVVRRTPVSLTHWRRANKSLQNALRSGDRQEAQRHAHTLLSYLREMGLLNEPARSISDSTVRNNCDGLVKQQKAKMICTT